MRDGAPVHGHTGLEIFWTVIPTIIVTVFGVWAAYILRDNEAVAKDHRRVVAQGFQFAWQFKYPDDGGFTASQLVLPVGEDVEVITESVSLGADQPGVQHSFFVKEWRVKADLPPGSPYRTFVT